MAVLDRVAMIKQCLQAALGPLSIEILDESHRHAGHAGAQGGGHFQVTLVADVFNGKRLLERHRMVYDALGPAMQTEIHALSIRAYTPQEFQIDRTARDEAARANQGES
ncbi:MAG TPA: BolA family protein [Gammaproteobacteria bacterium]|nr:BolA family protein [Gammaproteobacteria bacterium]